MLHKSSLLGACLLLSAPAFGADTCEAPINHPGAPFENIQPKDTKILSTYGHSPEVLPSRTSFQIS